MGQELLYELVEKDGIEKCLCHCDSYNPNFLLDTENKMYLIDWEYSGMSDPGCDLGTFIACSDYSIEQADRILELYLGHEPNCIELRHYIAYIAIAAFYWFIWALYQDSLGKNERNDYEFPKTITRIDITVIMILIGISLLLIFFCMIGVIKG